MGYSFTIGEMQVVEEDGWVSIEAEEVTREDAPAFGEPTDHTNSRWPSYSGWYNAMEDSGLFLLFYTPEGGLIGGHPGFVRVTETLVQAVKKQKRIFEMNNPALQAAYTGNALDEAYCRMVWLDYWLTWALENCANPIISNT